MKKTVYLIIVTLCLAASLLYWHAWETEARMQHRMATIAAIDWTEEKIKEGWSKEAAEKYGTVKLDSLGIAYPSKCPYCYVKALIK